MKALGKFPKTKLAIVAGSLLAVAVMSGAFAVPQAEPLDEPTQATLPAPAPTPVEPQQPPQVIRRVYVVRRTAAGAVEVAAAPQRLEAPPAAPPPAQPARPARPAAPRPAPQPVATSRGS
jgi:hypothetical protein